MIVKDGQGTLYRCLESVKGIADEIIVCDTGSSDRTREIAREYTDQVYEIPGEDDFAAARNRSIEKATGDWVLWLDADEYLVGAENLEKYLRDNMYDGYVIRQHHHAVDAEFKPDVPVRLFRNHKGIRFYGCVHEHPETALNAGVRPAVILSDVQIVHDGYVTEAIRRKRFLRNLPLVLKDRKRHPERRLGLVFLARDYIHLARYEMERTQGVVTDQARRYLARAAAIHRGHFASPDDPLYAYSFPLYQTALELMGEGFALGYFVAVAEEGAGGKLLPNNAPMPRVRVADEVEAREFLARHLAELLAEARGENEFPFEECG
jgi:glycosyltransferase involved in cell wall biosynthesis